MAEDIFRQSQRYLADRTEKLLAEAKFKKSAKPVKEWLDEKDGDGKFVHGVEDDDGNRVFKFARPMQGIDGKMYSGVMLKRSQGESYFDPDEVLEFLRHKPMSVQKRAIKTITVPDLDELYVLQQESKISEVELRSLMHDPEPQYALWPVESKAIVEE
jgi:hypothetical protein